MNEPNINEIPEQLKKNNGLFFERAKSGSAPDRIAGVENLVENLINTMQIANCHEYDIKLDKCKHWADRAHKDYYANDDIVMALRHCNAVIMEIGFLCYMDRWAKLQSDSFKYTSGVKNDH